MSKEMDFNEKMATEYDKGVRRTLPTYDSMLKLSQTYLRTNMVQQANVLVIGAGSGNELAALGPPNPGWTFTAVDPAPSMLDIAMAKVKQLQLTDRVDFIVGTVNDVETDKLYDGAACLLVLHFIQDFDEKLQTLKNIRKHLVPGAPFVMASLYGDKNDAAFNELFALWKAYWLETTKLTNTEMDDMEISLRALSFISEEEIKQLLSEAGFVKIAKFFTTNMFGGWICKAE